MRNHRTLLGIVLLLYLAAWASTRAFGPGSFETWARARLGENTRFLDNPRLCALDHETLILGDDLPAAPWHFIGNPASPCPFLLRMDAAFLFKPAGAPGAHGYGTSTWCLWFFGWIVPIGGGTHWSRCA